MSIFGKKRYPVSFGEFLAACVRQKSAGEAVNPAALLDRFIDRYGIREVGLKDSTEIERIRFKCELLRYARRQIDDEFLLTIIEDTLGKLRRLVDLYEDRDDLESRRKNRKQGCLVSVPDSREEVKRLTAKMAMIEENMKSGLLSSSEAKKLLDGIERELDRLVSEDEPLRSMGDSRDRN